ncbi:CHAP domain-containing protein [Acidocella sp.]|uniref:CHAP domain-containing protein n=1 Tax=Acidocella sp. TaxID=50710 RepID=UPI002620B28F|nr:CHAP domain-containing protein [Acidocella sp.]
MDADTPKNWCKALGLMLLAGASLVMAQPAEAHIVHHYAPTIHHHALAVRTSSHKPYIHKAYTHEVRHTHDVRYVHHVSHPLRERREEVAHVSAHSTAREAERHYVHHYVRTAHYRHSGLQCVPYAREVSHIALTGDAYLWWAEAAGRYARGSTPAEGAVLNFRPIGRMPLGHVAVVTGIINSRTILVTQANWVRGTITNDVTVQDVSPNNDWSQVEVELGDSSSWGAAYPTYGFIYDRPDTGTVIAANGQGGEVAEAPTVAPVATQAPNRNLQ